MFRTVADFYHTNNIAFSWMSDEYNGVTVDQYGKVRPAVTRHYDTLSQAAFENAESRILVGIHWPWDRDQGIRQGAEVADYTFRNVLRPIGADDRATQTSSASTLLGSAAQPAIETQLIAKAPEAAAPAGQVAVAANRETLAPSTFSESRGTQPAGVVGKIASRSSQSSASRDALFQLPEWWQ
jgi:hypothetical protein